MKAGSSSWPVWLDKCVVQVVNMAAISVVLYGEPLYAYWSGVFKGVSNNYLFVCGCFEGEDCFYNWFLELTEVIIEFL